MTASVSAPPPASGGDGGKGGPLVVGVVEKRSPYKRGSRKPAVSPQQQQQHYGAAALIDELVSLGYNGASAFVCAHDPARIRRAIDYALSLPDIVSVPAFVRYLVRSASPIPDPFVAPVSTIESEIEADPTAPNWARLDAKYPGVIKR